MTAIPPEVTLSRIRRESEARAAQAEALRAEIAGLSEEAEKRFEKLEKKVRKLSKSVDAAAALRIAETVVADESLALSERIETLSAELTTAQSTASATVEEVKRAVVTGSYAAAENVRRISASFNESIAAIESTMTTLATEDYVLARKAESIAVSNGYTDASVDEEAEARIDADGEIHAHWAVRLNAEGRVIGRIHLDGTGGTSTLDMEAGTIRLWNGSSAVAPFEVSGGVVRMVNAEATTLSVGSGSQEISIDAGVIEVGSSHGFVTEAVGTSSSVISTWTTGDTSRIRISAYITSIPALLEGIDHLGVQRFRISSLGSAVFTTVTADSFSGDLDASDLTSGTVNTARLPSTINISGAYQVGGTQVVGSRGAAIANAGTSNDLDAAYNETQLESLFNAFGSKINEILSRLRSHGLIAT